MRVVVVSATSVIAVSCVKRLAETGSHEFVLVGRSEERLSATSTDLALRFPTSKFSVELVDFTSTNSIEKMVESVSKTSMDLILVGQGSLTEQAKASSNLDYLRSELELNAVSVAVVAECFAGALAVQGKGTLGVIGSVAGDRGRAYNYSYGSGKALIEKYTQGLQQRFASSDVAVCLVKPGPTATPMTVSHSGKMADPNAVAKVIVAGLLARRRVIYAPKLWRYIMLIVKLIPYFIFKRLSF